MRSSKVETDTCVLFCGIGDLERLSAAVDYVCVLVGMVCEASNRTVNITHRALM